MQSSGRLASLLGWILLAVVLIALVVRAVDVLLVVFLAIILAVYLDAIADFLGRRFGVPETLGLKGVSVFVMAVYLLGVLTTFASGS